MAVLIMKNLLNTIWRKLGSIHLTVVLCLLLFVDLAWGYFCLEGRSILFSPLNQVGLTVWMNTYGRHDLAHTAWFFILMGFLTLLCVNTFICTTDRIIALLGARKRFTPGRFVFKLAPHIMHYAVILLITGYLGSYAFSKALDTRTLLPGGSMTLPGTSAKITFVSSDPLYYQGGRLPAFENRVLSLRSRLLLSDGEETKTEVLSCVQPVHFKGFGIFLKDFAPKTKKGGMAQRERIDLIIRKDPGAPWCLAGICLFSAGLLLYLADWMTAGKRGMA